MARRFPESHAGMQRSLVTGHTFSPDFGRDGTIYMVTTKGYYRSTDRGKNWVKQAYFPDDKILSLCVTDDYASTGEIYVLTSRSLHRVSGAAPANESERAAGERRSKLIKEFGETTFAEMRIANGRLFVHRVYYAPPKKKNGMELVDYQSGTVDVLDLGSSEWSPLAGDFERSVIADFDVSIDASTMVASLKDGSVSISNNGGSSWREALQRKDDFFCKVRLSPDYQETQTICAATAKGHIFLSKDGGETWASRSNGLSRWVHHVNILVNRLVFSPNYKNDKTIFLGKTTGFYKTTDDGRFWRHINVWNPKWGYYVYPAPGRDSTDVFTATYNSGISRSHDLGETWNSANIGITSAFANGMELSPNYDEDKTIFVMDIVTGLYQSSDAGRSWSKIDEVDTSLQSGNQVLYRELGVSSDFQEDGVILLFSVPRRTLDVKEKHAFRYNTKTKELKLVLIGSDTNYINDYAFSPTGSKTKRMFAGTAKGAFESRDGGNTWQSIYKPNNGGVDKVIVSPNWDNDGTIYLKSSRGGMLVSHDAGKSFRPTKLGLPGHYAQNLVFSPDYATDQTLYVSTYGEGVFRSRDAGTNWDYLGLKGKWLYTGPSFSANFSSDGTMFAPAVDGIYKSTDAGKTWKNVLDRTQFLAKVPFLTLKDKDGSEIPLNFGTAAKMKSYDMYDQEVGDEMYRSRGRQVEVCKDPRAYLASYYKFRVEKGAAVEVYFYGTSVDYKCVQGPHMGIVEIELDGESQGEFDLFSEKDRFDVTGFHCEGLEAGPHTLRILATGERGPNSSGTAFTFNAANIKN